MKKIICLFVLLALASGVHADDKKKKKPAGNNAPARAPGGGGGGGGVHMPNTQRNKPARSLGQMGQGSGAPRVNNRAGTSTTNRLKNRPATGGHAANPLSAKTGPAGGSEHSSNPLMKRGGAAGAKANGSNPLARNKRPAGAQNANPLAKKNAAQQGMNGRNANKLAGRNNANLNGKRGPGMQNARAQNTRGFNNRGNAANWQRGAHANYRVRNSRDVFHSYRAVRHDRGWYTSRYDRVVIVGGGYYYWDAGYWYPAWGYDPAFSFYVYDGPIYSYDNLPPDQVTMNVQTELQDQGYYTGDIDGQVGPKTRDALAAYQADHELEVTSAIDEPTVEALGLAGTS